MILAQLFWSFFQIGLFSIGGGYAALPMIQAQVIDHHGWLTMAEFTDVLTISQMTPGPIAINAATFVGTRIAGLPGAVIATVGCVTPSFIIVLALAYMYVKYKEMRVIKGALGALRPAVVALIASAGISIVALAVWGESISLAGTDLVAALILVAGLVVLRVWTPSPILVMLAAGVIGGGIYLVRG